MLEKLFPLDAQNGIPALLAAVCVLLTARLLLEVGKFLWGMKEKKDKLSEDSVKKLTDSVIALTLEIEKLRQTVSKVPAMETHLKRLFSAVKTIAGDSWPKIREDIIREHEF